MIFHRPRLAPILLVLAGLLAAYISLSAVHMIGVAHADTPAAVAVQPASTAGFDVGGTIAVVALVIGGLGMILGGLSVVLHAIAKRTVTTWDDTAAAEVDALHAKLDEVLALIGGKEPGVPTPARNPQSGKSALLVLLAVPLATALAWSLAVFVPACHYDTVKADAGALAHGTVTCAKADVPAVRALGLQLATEALVSAVSGHGIPWTQLEAEAEAGAKAQGIAIGSCAFGQLIADLSKLLPAPAPGVMARTDDGRGELELLKAHLGVTAIRTADGQVL